MFENREGKRVPEVTFKTRRGSNWVDVTSSELFDGRNVVVFSCRAHSPRPARHHTFRATMSSSPHSGPPGSTKSCASR